MVMLTLACFLGASSSPPPHHPVHRAPADLLSRIATSNPQILNHNSPPLRPLKTSGLRVTPAQFGGDPTGRADSWAALDAALTHCLNQSVLSPNGFFPGQDTTPVFGPIRDMGGCDIDLDGGEYLMSKTLSIPEMNANMQLGGGSLVAGPGFAGDFMIVIGTDGGCNFPQGSCNIDINFPELFIDGAKRASGMQINNVMGVTIGPGGYFLNFTEYGVQINKGHEVMMDRVWMGETNFDFDHVAYGVAPNATAIQINGNDHYILNTIVFSAKIGLEVNGAADYVTGVHVWFPLNAATAFADSRAFSVTKGGNRFMGCYIDGGRAIFEAGATKQNIWQQGFECCQRSKEAPGTTASGITLLGTNFGDGLQIINNKFGGGSIYHRDAIWPTAAEQTRDWDNCSARFNASLDGVACMGMTRASSGDATEDACAAACCADASCSAWQWCKDDSCDGVSAGGGPQCWTGARSECTGHGSRAGWVGRSAAGPPAPPAPSPIAISGVRIAHNDFTHGAVGTQATKSLTQTAATTWAFDFCAELLFAQIAVTHVHVVAASGFPIAVARPATGCTLTVETSEAVTGTITVDVDSSAPSAKFL